MLARFRKARAMYYKGGGRDDRGGIAPEPKEGYDLPLPVEQFPNDEAADAAAASARAQDIKIANTLNQSGGREPIAKDEVEVHQFSNATPQGNEAMKNLQEIKLQQDFNKSTDVANNELPDKHKMGGFRKRKRWPPQKKKTRKRKKKKKRRRKTKRGGPIPIQHKKSKKIHGHLQSHNIYNPVNPIMRKIGGKKKTRKYKKRKRRRTRRKK